MNNKSTKTGALASVCIGGTTRAKRKKPRQLDDEDCLLLASKRSAADWRDFYGGDDPYDSPLGPPEEEEE